MVRTNYAVTGRRLRELKFKFCIYKRKTVFLLEGLKGLKVVMKEYMSTSEFMEKFDLSQSMVNDWIRSGRIKAIKFESSKRTHYRIPLSEVERLEKDVVNKSE